MSRYYNQTKSQNKRYGVTKHEDYLEQCFRELRLPCKRKQVFCFICLSMWENDSNEFPHECRHCGTAYKESRMYCMPDLVIEDPGRHGKAVVFVNGQKYHSDYKARKKDQFQIDILKKNNWKVFTIFNEEIDYLKHANRCFWVLGIYRAMLDLTMYNRAFLDEKELLH